MLHRGSTSLSCERSQLPCSIWVAVGQSRPVRGRRHTRGAQITAFKYTDPASTAEVSRATSEPTKRAHNVTLDSSSAFSEEFRDLVHTQLSLLLEVLRQPQWQATLFARAPQNFSTRELDLLRIASAGPGLCECRDSHLLLDHTNSAEDTLSRAEVIEVSDEAIVLPLAHQQSLVGLLFIEGSGSPVIPALTELTAEALSSSTALSRARQHRILQALGEQGFQLLKQASQVLCLACSLDQRAGLQRSRDAAKSQHISGLVEQARGPLSALRTLGAMLVPRTQDVNRDVADGIVVQGNRLQDLVVELQMALKPSAVTQTARYLPVAGSKEAQLELQECNVGEVLESVAVSVQHTCHSVGVVLDLPEQLVASSQGLMPASHSAEASIAPSRAVLSSPVTPKRSVQWEDSKADSSRSTVLRAPALLPPPSRVALANLKRPAMAGFRADVNSEVLHIIMSCLLDSAIQRTPRGGTVRIRMQYLGEGIKIQVSDCGQEMAEHLNTLLQSSSAAHAESAQETDTSAEAAMQRIAKGLPTGSGIIALAVANSQAHAASCHIRIEPRQASDRNSGTTVSLWLPAS